MWLNEGNRKADVNVELKTYNIKKRQNLPSCMINVNYPKKSGIAKTKLGPTKYRREELGL